jgi:hypothetical protein
MLFCCDIIGEEAGYLRSEVQDKHLFSDPLLSSKHWV